MSNVWGVTVYSEQDFSGIQRLRNELVTDKNVVSPVTT